VLVTEEINLPPRKRLMLTFASQTFANGIWTITPEEPATLPLVLVGLGTLAAYAAFAGCHVGRRWR
jgi:hypothetical protein